MNKPELLDTLRILLDVLERSSPHTDITHTWKCENWYKMRNDAIAKGRLAISKLEGE